MTLTKSKIFLILGLCFIAGVGTRSFVQLPMFFLYAMMMAGIFILAMFWKSKYMIFGAGLLFLVFGIVRYELSIPRTTPDRIEFYNGKQVSFEGVVWREPDVRKDHVKLTVKSKRITLDGAAQPISGSVLVNTELYPTYQYGDFLAIECELEKPEPVEASAYSAQRDFAYDKYLARFDIYAVCYRANIKSLATGKGNAIMEVLLQVKSGFVRVIQQSLPEPHASFLGGLILGARRAIPEDLITAFNRTGTTHIIALSGYNITIIGVFVMNLCKALWIPRKKAFWISVMAILFFILITGAPASVVRAGIMGMLVLLAMQLGRMSRVTNVLILVALIMVLINPKVLVFDTGFQLSFLATLGLVYVSPMIEKRIQKVPNVLGIRANLVATLSAIIMTTPLILYTFGRFSLLAPVVNVLILPVIPMAMATGFLMGIAGFLWLPLGQFVGYIVWLILSYILYIIESFARLKWTSFNTDSIHWVWSILFYGLMFFAIYYYKKRKDPLRPKGIEDLHG